MEGRMEQGRSLNDQIFMNVCHFARPDGLGTPESDISLKRTWKPVSYDAYQASYDWAMIGYQVREFLRAVVDPTFVSYMKTEKQESGQLLCLTWG